VQTAGLDTTPRLELVQPATNDPDEGCPAPTSWQALWTAQFQRNGWTKTQPQSLTLRDSFYCRHIPVFRFSLGYYRLIGDIALREANAVFVLNGRVFRKPATLLSAHGFMSPAYNSSNGTSNLDAAVATAVQTFVPQGVSAFSGRVGLADVTIPVIPATPVHIAAGTASPDNAAARAAQFHPDEWESKWDVPFYPVSKYTPALAKKGRLILKGTVARISLDGQYPQWLRIYFKESPDNAVTLCTPSADIFDEFGDGYRGLIGRTVEAAGDIDGLCTPKGGIRIVQSNQFRALSTETAVP
jgi:hypothetical protein